MKQGFLFVAMLALGFLAWHPVGGEWVAPAQASDGSKDGKGTDASSDKDSESDDSYSCQCPSGIENCVCSDGTLGKSGCSSAGSGSTSDDKSSDSDDGKDKSSDSDDDKDKSSDSDDDKDKSSDSDDGKDKSSDSDDGKDKSSDDATSSSEVGTGGTVCGSSRTHATPREIRSILGQ
ncbi:MAG: hypothetical protein D6678_02175 [Zetaproteobacteria bacterium]|nr:MAG: hypothetical protein D6678_02175 [Zetaproteobacteria bacterium]